MISPTVALLGPTISVIGNAVVVDVGASEHTALKNHYRLMSFELKGRHGVRPTPSSLSSGSEGRPQSQNFESKPKQLCRLGRYQNLIRRVAGVARTLSSRPLRHTSQFNRNPAWQDLYKTDPEPWLRTAQQLIQECWPEITWGFLRLCSGPPRVEAHRGVDG